MEGAKSGRLRAESLLALAELQPEKGLDLLPVKKFEPMVQAYVLSSGIDAGLVKTEQMEDLVRWPDLEPGLYISIASRVVAAQRRLDPARLRQLLGGNDPIISTMAGILLKQLGQGDNASANGDKLLNIKPAPPSEALRRVLGVIRERKLVAGADFAHKVMAHAANDRLLRFDAVSTLLVIEPSADRAGQLLVSELAAAPDPAEKLRLALAAASASMQRDAGVPAPVVDALRHEGEPALVQIGDALAAIASRADAASQLTRLVERRSGKITEWVLIATKDLPPETARAARLAIVRSALEGDDATMEALAAEAAFQLAQDDPQVLREPLLQAIQKRDDRTAGRILGAGLRAHNPRSATLADMGRLTIEPGSQPVWPSTAVGAIATMLKARFTEKLSPGQLDQLAKIATGGGNLPEALRMQAAWLALKGATDDRAALARMLAETGAE